MKTKQAALAALAALALISPPKAYAAPSRAAVAVHPIERMAHISIQQLGTKGTPIILIPGMSTPREVWSGIAPDLARNHRVFLVQINGFGSDHPGANLGTGLLDGISADISAFIQSRRLRQPAVIGHSLGGLIGLMLALREGEKLDRLMVVDALPFYSVLVVPPASTVTPDSIKPVAEQIRTGIKATYGRELPPEVLEVQSRGMALAPSAQVQIRGWVKAADPRVTGQLVYEDMTTDLRPELARIRLPVTLAYPGIQAAIPAKPQRRSMVINLSA